MASRRAPQKPHRVPAPAPPRERPWLAYVLLAVVTLAAYQPAWHGGVLWDDDAHLTAAPLMSWQGLGRIWTDFRVTQQYYPVVNTAFWIMNRLWGQDTFGYHLVNILLHAFSAFLIWRILRRWSVPGSMIAAAVFALHPLQVESVAWMTELKNTLSGVFYLLAAIAYLRFDQGRDRRWYAAALAAFVLALGSKTVTATLPAALLVVFWWQRGRIEWRRDVVPLVPWFAVGVVAGVGTAWLEVHWVGAKGHEFAYTFLERTLLAARVAWFYVGKILWPVDLMFWYPRWVIDQSVWWQYLFPVALVALVGALWAIRGRTRAPLAGVLYFCGTLFPVLGFLNVYPFRYSFVADHFAYLASLGLIVLLSAGLALTVARWRPGVPEQAIAAIVVAPLFVLTFLHSRDFASGQALYRATLAANSSSVLARNNLAALLLDGPSDGWVEAGELAQAALRINPNDSASHNNLGVLLQRTGRYAESIAELREAIRLSPGGAALYYNLGISLASRGDLEEAVAAYKKSLEIQPDRVDALHNLGKTLAQLQRFDEAIDRLRSASQLAPDSRAIMMSLGNVFQLAHNFDAAIATYSLAVRRYPDWGEAQHNLALALRGAGRLDEALAAFGEAERLLPQSSLVQLNMAVTLVSVKRLEEAVPHFERALPGVEAAKAPDVHNGFGVILAMLGRFDQAKLHFAEAVRLRPDFAEARANLERAQRGGK